MLLVRDFTGVFLRGFRFSSLGQECLLVIRFHAVELGLLRRDFFLKASNLLA